MRRFDIVANCSANYTEAMEFSIPSWVKNSGADNIFIYTDGEIENKWGDKVKIIPVYEKSDDWMVWCDRKTETLCKYLETAPEGTTFFLTDVDCYAVKSWRLAVEDLGWWFRVIRNDKTIEDASGKEAVSIFFGAVCAEMQEFAKRWNKEVVNFSKNNLGAIKAIKNMGICGHDQLWFQRLIKDYKTQNLSENIWSNERDDYYEWKRIVTKYRDLVRVLHFKGGRWKDKKIVKEILGLLPDVKEYYHKHSQVKKISARILRILHYVPKYVINKDILDVGCGNRIITTCMSVYGNVTGIDIDDDVYEYKTDKKYDVVCCFDVFEHLPDVSKAIEKVRGFCKPGGLILVNQPEVQHPIQPIDNLVPIDSLFGLGKLVFLENYAFAHLGEVYNFMVFVR